MRRVDQPLPVSERWICPKCTGARSAHYLTCPTLRLQGPVTEVSPDEG